MLLDWAESILNRVVGRAEVAGNAANVDLFDVVSSRSLGRRSRGRGRGLLRHAYFHSARDDGSDEFLPDFDRVPGDLARTGHGC